MALFGHQEAGGLNIPTTTADTMGISPALPCKNVLQPKQAHGPEGGPTTPANAEKVSRWVVPHDGFMPDILAQVDGPSFATSAACCPHRTVSFGG